MQGTEKGLGTMLHEEQLKGLEVPGLLRADGARLGPCLK